MSGAKASLTRYLNSSHDARESICQSSLRKPRALSRKVRICLRDGARFEAPNLGKRLWNLVPMAIVWGRALV